MHTKSTKTMPSSRATARDTAQLHTSKTFILKKKQTRSSGNFESHDKQNNETVSKPLNILQQLFFELIFIWETNRSRTCMRIAVRMQQLRLHYCVAISLHTQLEALLRTDTQNALQNAEHNAKTARVRNKTMCEELRQNLWDHTNCTRHTKFYVAIKIYILLHFPFCFEF